MNSPCNEPSDSRFDNPWNNLFQSEWQRQVLDDAGDFDEELISAYAEGNVSEGERAAAERILAEHAAALDLLVVLKEQIATSHLPSAENPWRELFEEEGNREGLAKQQPYDDELIAVFAEGKATEAEARQAEQILANNPSALELFLILRQQIAEAATAGEGSPPAGSAWSADGQSAALPGDVSSPSARARTAFTEIGPARSTRLPSHFRVTSVITVASLMMATTAVFWSMKQRSRETALNKRVAALNQQAVSQALALTSSQQERMATTSASSLPLYVVGRVSASFLEAAIAGTGPVARGDLDSDPPEIRGAREATLLSASTTLERWRQASADNAPAGVLVAQASLQISLAQLDAAAETIGRLERELGESAAEVRNLRALLLLALAESQPMSEATLTFSEARLILESLVQSHPEFAEGGVNLALFLDRQLGSDDPATRGAWERCLAAESREDVRQVIRKRLEHSNLK